MKKRRNVQSIGNVVVGGRDVRIEEVDRIAHGLARVSLSRDRVWARAIRKNHEVFSRMLSGGGMIYGVNTGFGHSGRLDVPDTLVNELPRQLVRFHGCGMGGAFDLSETRAIMMARLISLARGYSGVRPVLIRNLAALLQRDVLPIIPQEGSVGASGDLTPLSYVAAVLMGEREVVYQGAPMQARKALRRAGLKSLRLYPKESLALMNGTSAMTGLACLAWQRSDYLLKLAARITALSVVALQGNRSHFAPELSQAKPHPGQVRVAALIYDDLPNVAGHNDGSMQDRYSIRCAPHILGVLADALTWTRSWIEIELNSANDNPIVDPKSGRLFHGGHFYGGHIAFAMDSLKAAIASVADLLDRQIALLVDPNTNKGLPENLTGATQQRRPINHGLKAVQICASAWTAEALKLTMPAASFSRSTECHNQDKVSMGTISARDCHRILELSEQVAAAALLAAAQGVELRRRAGGGTWREPGRAISAFLGEVANDSQFLEEDRALDLDLRRLCGRIRERDWVLYEE